MWPTIMMLVFLQATIGFRVSSIAVPCNRTYSFSVEPLVLIQNFTTYTLDNCDTMITFSSNQSISNVQVIANGGNVTPSVFVTGRVLEEVRIGLYDIVSQPPPTEPPVWLKLLSFIGTSTASSLAVAHNIVVRVSNTTLSNYQGDLVYIGAPIVDGFILILEDSDFTYAQMAETSVYLYGRQIGTNAEFIGASVSNVKMTQIGGRWNVTVHSYNRTMGFWSIFGYLTTTNVEFVVQETTTILTFSHEVSINITIDKYCLQVIDVTDPGNLINFATTLTDFTFVNTMEMDPRVEDCTTDFRILFLSASGADEPPNVNVSNVAISVSNAKFTMFGANQGLMFQYRGYSHISSASFVAENVSSTVIAQGLSADSARSTVLLTYVIVAQLTNWSFIARNILFHGELNHANKLEYYSSSTGCLLLLQNAQTEIGVVDILNASVDAVVNERTVGNVLGVGVLMNQFAVTLSLVVFLSSVSTTVSIDIKDSVINTHGTVVGPYFSGLATVFVNYVALCVGVVVMQNNCTSCNISLLRTNINASKTYILPPDSPSAWPITDNIICNVLSSLNITAFVIGIDPSIVIQTCLIPNMEFLKNFPTIMSSIYGISMDPMLHTMMNVTVKDSWIRTPDLDPTDVNQRSLGVSVLGAPRLVDNVHLNASNVTSYGAYTVASTMIFAMTRANDITVYLEDVSGLQHWIETRIFYANISNFKLIMNRGHFIRHPFAQRSLFDTFSLTLQPTSAPLSAITPFISIVNTTFDAGVAGIFGATLNLDNMPRKSIYLGCNLWGAANRTTVDVYRQQAVFPVNRTRRFDAHQSQLDLSGACVPPPTPAPPTPPPTTSPATSRGASAVAIVGLSVASSIPSVGATPSFVRLQTTIIALKIRDMCDSDDESNTVVYGESPFENPTQVSVPSLGDDYAMAGGTVLMNIVLVVAVAVLAASLRIAPKMWKQRDNMAILSWKSKLKIWLRHFPGSGVVLFSVFLQPTITSAVSVMTSGSGNGIIIGLIGLMFFMGVLIYVSYIVIKTFPMYFRLNPPRQPKIPAEKMRTRVRHDSDDDDDDECCGEEWTSFWITFSESPGEWVVSSSPSQHQRSSQINRSATSFHHRYSALYEPFRGGWHWYFVVDLAVAALSGLVSGLAGAPLPCDVVLWLLVGLCGISAAGSLFIRPSGPPMENLINIVVNGLGLASCVTIALSLDSISNDVALAQLVASMIMSVVDAFRWFFGLFWQRNIRHRARRKLKEQLRAMFGDIQYASRKVGQHGSAMLHRAFQRSTTHINTPKGRLQALILQICESQKKNRQSFSSSRSTGGSSTPRSQLQAAHVEERRQLFQHSHPTHSHNDYNHHQRRSSSPPSQPTAVHRQFLWTQKQFADHVDPNDL